MGVEDAACVSINRVANFDRAVDTVDRSHGYSISASFDPMKSAIFADRSADINQTAG